ncbi:MAG: type II secretion system F family protein [Propionibacterium sp.]|nr:type II secretion system F family protein [Propionibacterium sp.]
MSLFNSSAGEWVGFGLLLLAAVLAFSATIRGRNELPMSRRRPDVAAPPSVLSHVAAAATQGAGRLVSGRGDSLDEALVQAGIRAKAADVLVLVGIGTFVAFVVGLAGVDAFFGLLLAVLVPVAFWMVLRVRTSRRRAAFSEQLSEVLQILASGLRAGASLPQSMQMVAAESDEPTKTEFTRVSNEMRVGRPIGAALEDVASRMKSLDFSWVAQAVMINREVGGNLADVLDGVASTMRERASLRRQVKTLSAEGKMSGWILMALPVGVFLMVYMMHPAYFLPLVASPIGWLLIGAAVLLMIIGAVWLWFSIQVKY